MPKMSTVSALALALSLLLVGCASFDRVNHIKKQADEELHHAKQQFTQLTSGSPVQELSTQWINPLPLNSTTPTRAPLPGCAVTFTRPGEVTLAEVSAFITRTCRVAVVVTPDAQFSAGQGKTEKMQGALPAPEASGMVPLEAIGGNERPNMPSNRPGRLRGVYWQGSLAGLLDDVTTRLGLSWRYEQGRVSIFYLDTRTFPVMFLDSKTAFSSKVVSGTTTSSGASGSSGGLSGDVNTSQITTTEMKGERYHDLQNTVKAMLTPGTGRLFLAAGLLTVTDTPRVLGEVQRHIDDRNKELTRQVVLNVKVFSVAKRQQDQMGIDWQAVFNAGRVAGSPPVSV